MKKLLAFALLAAGGIGLTARPASAIFWEPRSCYGCCLFHKHHDCCGIEFRQYNAFSPPCPVGIPTHGCCLFHKHRDCGFPVGYGPSCPPAGPACCDSAFGGYGGVPVIQDSAPAKPTDSTPATKQSPVSMAPGYVLPPGYGFPPAYGMAPGYPVRPGYPVFNGGAPMGWPVAPGYNPAFANGYNPAFINLYGARPAITGGGLPGPMPQPVNTFVPPTGR